VHVYALSKRLDGLPIPSSDAHCIGPNSVGTKLEKHVPGGYSTCWHSRLLRSFKAGVVIHPYNQMAKPYKSISRRGLAVLFYGLASRRCPFMHDAANHQATRWGNINKQSKAKQSELPTQRARARGYCPAANASTGKVLVTPARLLKWILPVGGSSTVISLTGGHSMSSLALTPLSFLMRLALTYPVTSES
jgi:hypothetical protein